MKPVILLFLAFYTPSMLFAQRSFVGEEKNVSTTSSYTKTLSCADTLGLCAYNSASQVLYKDQLGGFTVGTNFFGDLAKAQQFSYNDSIRYNIRKVMFYFGSKKKIGLNSYLQVSIYTIDSLGFAADNKTKPCPDTILATRKLFLDSIDTIAGRATTVNFDWGVSTKGNFAVGFDMSQLDTADRVGLYSTKDSSALKTELSWEKQRNGRWYTMLRSWPLDINFAIFPIVDKTAIGISEIANSELFSIAALPNPANESTKISYHLSESKNVLISLTNALGKVIYRESLGNKTTGLHQINLETVTFPAGIYSLSVQTDQFRQSKKLLVIH